MADTFIEEIVDWMQADGIGTKGQSLFISEMPDDETDDPSVVVQEFPGGQGPFYSLAPTINMGITVRSASYAIARAKASHVYNRLHAVTGLVLENSRILYMACGTPGSIGTDSRNRELIRMSFLAKAHGYTAPGEGAQGEEDVDDGGSGDKDPNPGDLPGGGD